MNSRLRWRIGDRVVDHACGQVDRCGEGHGSEAFVLVVTPDRRVLAGLGRQIGRRRGDRLKPGLLVIGDDDGRALRLWKIA
jgi:hypothetical protein